MYNLRMLFADAARCGARKEVSEATWAAFCSYLAEVLKMGKGIKVPKFGAFTCKRNSERDSAPGIKRHVFFLVPTFARSYGVQPKPVGPQLLVPCLEFNWAKLAYKAELDKDLAQTTLEVLFRTLGQAIATGQACRIQFGDVGVMVVQQRDVVFKFVPANSYRRGEYAEGELPELTSTNPDVVATQRLLQELTQPTMDEPEEPEELEPAAPPPMPVASIVAPTLNVDGPLGGGGSAAMMPVPESKGMSARVKRHRARTTTASVSSTASRPDEHTVSIFPRFTSADGRDMMKPNPARDRNLAASFERLRASIDAQKAREDKYEADMRRRQQSSTQELLDRAKRQREKQEELNSYLKKQAEEQKEHLRRQHEHDQMGSEAACGRIFPAERQLDLVRERAKKQALRNALDEQVQYKKNLNHGDHDDEIAREKFLLECLEDQVKEERIKVLEKREEERRTLSQAWELQKSFRSPLPL